MKLLVICVPWLRVMHFDVMVTGRQAVKIFRPSDVLSCAYDAPLLLYASSLSVFSAHIEYRAPRCVGRASPTSLDQKDRQIRSGEK